jgi:hypothetical protein
MLRVRSGSGLMRFLWGGGMIRGGERVGGRGIYPKFL